MAVKKQSKKPRKKLVVGSDPPIVITGGGGGPIPFTTPNQVEIEFTDPAGRKVKIKPKHGGVRITQAVLTVDIVKGGTPTHQQFTFDSQTDYKISIQFFTDTTLKNAGGSASAKKGAKKGSKKASKKARR